MNIHILHLHPEATTPTYATDGSACFDLSALHHARVPARGRVLVSTGIAVAVPEGWSLYIRARSGLAVKHGVLALHGTIDPDYTGEIKVLLLNHSKVDHNVESGDRIAQARLTPSPRVTFRVVEQLALTERGAGGFGSSGI